MIPRSFDPETLTPDTAVAVRLRPSGSHGTWIWSAKRPVLSDGVLKYLKTNFVSFKKLTLKPPVFTTDLSKNTLTQISRSYLSPALFQLTQPLPMIAFGGPTTLGAVLESFFFLEWNEWQFYIMEKMVKQLVQLIVTVHEPVTPLRLTCQ